MMLSRREKNVNNDYQNICTLGHGNIGFKWCCEKLMIIDYWTYQVVLIWSVSCERIGNSGILPGHIQWIDVWYILVIRELTIGELLWSFDEWAVN